MQKVVVEGAVPDAEIMLEVNGRLQTQPVERADDLGRATFDLTNNGQVPFVARPGTTIRAFARLGAASVYSPSETVRDFSDVYPAGPPEPELAIIYTCGKGSVAWGVPPDVRTFLSSEHAGGPRQQRAHSDRAPPRFFWWSPTTAAGDVFDASYEMCGTPVQSPTVTAVDYPGPLPKPELRKVVEGERMVEIWNYAPGVSATIVNQNGDVRWSGVIADGDFVPLSLSSPVQPNEQLEVTIELCPGQLVTSDPAPPTACGAIEPPRIATPMPDQTDIWVIDALPGAIVEVFEAGGTILGRGPASAPIRLRRALRGNERIVVVQETRNGCRSRNGHAYVVPSPLPPQDGDAWAASLFLEAIRAAPPQFRPPFFDNRVYDPVRNPYGTRLQLQTQGFPDALAGPVMLGQPINAFALYDANQDGVTARLAHSCVTADGARYQSGPIPMFEHPAFNPGELLCTGVHYRRGANLILVFEVARTAGGAHATQFLTYHAHLDPSGGLRLIGAHGGDVGRMPGDPGQIMNHLYARDLGVMQYQTTPATGSIIGRIRGSFMNLMLRGYQGNSAGVGEMQAVFSGAFDLPIYAD